MQHPDEGTIHAWLDGALPPDEARAMTEHVATCAACADAVAEARGLLAASSRILSALDAVPGGVLPAADVLEEDATVRRARPVSWWRSTPWRAAAAIVVVGSVGWLASRPGRVKDGPATVMTSAEARDVAAFDTTPMVAQLPPSAPTRATASPSAERVAAPSPVPQSEAGSRSRRVAKASVPAEPVAPTAEQLAPVTPGRAAREKMMMAQVAPLADSIVVANSSSHLETRVEPPAITSAGAGAAARPGSRPETSASDNLELRAKSSAPVLMGRVAGAAVAAAPMATLMPGGDALQRLAGCYVLASPAGARADERDASAAPVLPPRLELLTTPAATGASELTVRAAPGAAAFAAGTRGSWRPLGLDALLLRIADASGTTSLTLTLSGDSVSGQARVERNAGTGWSGPVRGRKAPCAAP